MSPIWKSCTIAILVMGGEALMQIAFAEPSVSRESVQVPQVRQKGLDDLRGTTPSNVLSAIANLRSITRINGPILFVAGYHHPGDGGGGYYYSDLNDKSSRDNGGTVIVSADGTRWKLLQTGSPSVKQFGAKGNGIANDTLAFANALAESTVVHVPHGDFLVTGNLTISRNGGKLRGEGPTATRIIISTQDKVGISINGNLNNVELSGFTLTRSVDATAGAYGVDTTRATIGQSVIRDLVVEKHFRNIGLGPTDHSILRDVISQMASNTGVYLTNTVKDGTTQWTLENVLSQKNGKHGFLFEAIPGPAQITLGAWRNVATYANSGHGMAVIGLPAVPVHGIRITGGFFGEDGDSEILIDSHGGQHQIANSFVELAGRGKTGPKLDVSPSNLGSGIEITNRNANVLLNGVQANGNSFDGYRLDSELNVLDGCRSSNNGQARTAGRQNGILSVVGRLVISGGSYGNAARSTTQQYGVFVSNGKNLTLNGADLSDNRAAPFWATANINAIAAPPIATPSR